MVCIDQVFKEKHKQLLSVQTDQTAALCSDNVVALSQEVDQFITLFQHNKNGELTIDWKEHQDSFIFTLSGELRDSSVYSLAYISEMLLPVLFSKKHVVVCGHNLTYIDSAGVKALLDLALCCKRLATEIEFHLFPCYMFRVLEMIGFFRTIETLQCSFRVKLQNCTF